MRQPRSDSKGNKHQQQIDVVASQGRIGYMECLRGDPDPRPAVGTVPHQAGEGRRASSIGIMAKQAAVLGWVDSAVAVSSAVTAGIAVAVRREGHGERGRATVRAGWES